MFETAELGSKIDKQTFEQELPGLRVDLLNAQYDLRSAPFPVVVVLVGDDRAAASVLVNQLNGWMDARLIDTRVFGELTPEEQQRPRLWRYWRALPRKGRMAIFAGQWALATLLERLRGEIDDAALDERLRHVERFERALVDDGALVLKYWLHLPPKERKRRLKKARKNDEPSEEEAELHASYETLLPLFERTLRITGSSRAPWEIVESSDWRHCGLAVARSMQGSLAAALARQPDRSEAPPATAAAVSATTSVLDTVDLSASVERDEYREQRDALQERIRSLSLRAREKGLASVLVFEGWDAAGKGGAIRRVIGAMDVQDYRVVSIGAPSEEERAHHYLWRFWRELPIAGRMLIFDRSWYGRVLVERVEGLAREAEWQRAYEEIVDFEQQLLDHGLLLLKFWLHIDADEQEQRFQARLETPYKKYKLTAEDYRNRARRDGYEAAVNDMVTRTSSERAPWRLVPANDKRFARLEVMRAVCDGLEGKLGAE